MLIIDAVNKHYKKQRALRDISAMLKPGIHMLIGPNGSGKSTLLRLLAGVLPPEKGRICFAGQDAAKNPCAYRMQLGYLPQRFGVYPEMSGRKFLSYMAELKGLDRIRARQRVSEVAETIGLSDVLDRPAAVLSGGMKRRLGIAQALLNQPRLLLLDEPLAALGPEEKLLLRELLAKLGRNCTIVLSSHVLSEIAMLNAQVLLLNAGRLCFQGGGQAFAATVAGKVWQMVIPRRDWPEMNSNFCISDAVFHGGNCHIRLVSSLPPADRQSTAADPLPEDAYIWWTERESAKGVCER